MARRRNRIQGQPHLPHEHHRRIRNLFFPRVEAKVVDVPPNSLSFMRRRSYRIFRTHRDARLSRRALVWWWFVSIALIGGLIAAVVVTVTN